jgi:hypothetical protein
MRSGLTIPKESAAQLSHSWIGFGTARHPSSDPRIPLDSFTPSFSSGQMVPA